MTVSREGETGSRPYASEIRRRRSAETRRRILDRARDLVVERGYAGTTVAEVARRAGVHVDTVYALVGRKPVILHELVENAISGTDHAVDPLERDYVQAMRAEPDAGRKLDLYAGAMSRIHERLAPLFLALRDASRADPEAGRIWSAISERRALNMRRLADDLLSTGQIRPDLTLDQVADLIWVTNSPDVHQLLVQDRGWTPERYQAWLSDSWRRLLLTHP
jgi:AcrR family transcriptional regulator